MNKKISNTRKTTAKVDDERIEAALNQATRDAVDAHKKAGQKLVVWHEGQTTWIEPDAVPGSKTPNSRMRKRK